MGKIYIVYIATYICVILIIAGKYLKIRKHPEQYDHMDAIYAYDPRFRYAKDGELVQAARDAGSANLLVMLSAIPAVILNCTIYYLLRRQFFPDGSIPFIPEIANIWILAIISEAFFSFVVFCIFGHCKSGFLQALSLNSMILDKKEKFVRSSALRRHLVVCGILFAVVFPMYVLFTFNYSYITSTAITNNPFFSLKEDIYQMDECQIMVLRYRKYGKNESNKEISTQLNVVGKDGKQLVLTPSSSGIFKGNIDCSDGMIESVTEQLREYGVPLIKPDMTEEEFYSVLDWNGEEFLQFYYPELWEQYGIHPRF